MIRIREIAMPPEHNPAQLSFEAARLLKIPNSKVRQLKLVRRSIDARKKPDVKIVYTVDVKIEGVENAIIIPVDALRQTSAISYVFTTYTEETKQYGGMVEVTTGMQNDNYVEILSGLQVGDTVYYTEQQNFFQAMFGAMGMGGMSGGQRPNMGSGMGSGSGQRPNMGGGMPGGMPSGMPSGGMGGRNFGG